MKFIAFTFFLYTSPLWGLEKYYDCHNSKNSSFDILLNYEASFSKKPENYNKKTLPSQGKALYENRKGNTISKVKVFSKREDIFTFEVLRFFIKERALERYYVEYISSNILPAKKHAHSIPKTKGRTEITELVPFNPPRGFRLTSFKKSQWACEPIKWRWLYRWKLFWWEFTNYLMG